MNRTNNPFQCDQQSKLDFIVSTNRYWKENAPQWRLKWYGSDSEGKPVSINDESSIAHIDLYMCAINGDKRVWYAFELKERYLDSTAYDEWFLNPEKKGFLNNAGEKGYIPVFVNLFTDNIIRLWRLDKVNTERTITKSISRHTVLNDEKIQQKRILLSNDDSTSYIRINYKLQTPND